MLPLLPLFAVKVAALTITVGQALGIGATAFGVGAGIKGALDYQKAKKIKAEADAEYQKMASRIRRQTRKLKKNSRTLAA